VVFAVSNIPIRVPTHFLGRDDALAAIETALHRYEGRVAITALHGLRGVGKTTLAAASSGTPSRRLPGHLVDQGADRARHIAHLLRPLDLATTVCSCEAGHPLKMVSIPVEYNSI
jgi:hypothetical protein